MTGTTKSKCRMQAAAAMLPLLLLAHEAAATQADAGEAFSFRFAPPDGTEFTQTLVTTRENTFEGLGRQLDRGETKTAVAIRRVEDGYIMTTRTLSAEMTRDGKPMHDPVAKILSDAVLRIHIGADGRIRDVKGYGDLLEKIRASFPASIAEALEKLLDEDVLVQREIAEWNGRVGDFVGGEFEIGDSIASEAPYALPNGQSIVFVNRTSFPGREACEAGSCVRVKADYDSDATALGKATSEALAGAAAKVDPDAKPPVATDSRVSGSSSRLIDPDTMLIYAETLTRTIEMKMELPGRGPVASTMKEERTYSFDYRQGGASMP